MEVDMKMHRIEAMNREHEVFDVVYAPCPQEAEHNLRKVWGRFAVYDVNVEEVQSAPCIECGAQTDTTDSVYTYGEYWCTHCHRMAYGT